MIDICIGQKNACDRSVARYVALWLQSRRAFDLLGQIRRGVYQPPVLKCLRVGADCDARLCLRVNLSVARCNAVYTCAVPLRQTATGRAAEDVYPNQTNLSS